jgi:hypothetical protein
MDILWPSAMAKFRKHVLIMKMVLWTKVLVTHKSGKEKRQLCYQTGKRGIVVYPKLDIMWQRAEAKLGKHILIMVSAVGRSY